MSRPAIIRRGRPLVLLVVLLVTGLGGAGVAGLRAEDAWAPPVPAPDDFDWIQLKSGEWLKGRIKAMQDRELEFDSEELDDQVFDWEDIRYVRSPHDLVLLFVDRQTVSGTVTITPAEVRVGGAVPQTFARADLDSITLGTQRGIERWSGKLSMGATFRTGNSEQVDYNAKVNLQRRTPATRLALDYIGNISELEGQRSADNHRVNSEFDIWLSRRFYLVVPFVEYLRDPLLNLEYRINGGVGVGYDIIDTPRLEWTVSSGPAYQYAEFASVEAGLDRSSRGAAWIFSSRFDWELTSRVDLILEYRGQYAREEIGETTHHGVATLELEVTKLIDLDLSLIWDRISKPKPQSDGTLPDPDDFRLVLSLGVDF